MAVFKVLKGFRITEDTATEFIAPGAIFIEGDVINGFITAEAAELYDLFPECLEPLDEEAGVIHTRYVARLNVGGSVGATGDGEVR